MTTTTCLHDFFPFFVRNLFLRLKAKEQSLQSCALESHCEVFVFNRGIDTLDPSVMKRMPVDLIARWGPCIVLSSERAGLVPIWMPADGFCGGNSGKPSAVLVEWNWFGR